jgi:hypothetical protein
MKRWSWLFLALAMTLTACGSAMNPYGGSGGSGGGNYTNTTPPWHVVYKNTTVGTNNSAVPVDNTLYDDGATVDVMGNTNGLMWTGWHITGWNTEDNGPGLTGGGGGTSYPLTGGTFTIHANTTLYGVWAQD